MECFILDRLGKASSHFSYFFKREDFAFELCVGQNGRVWLSAATARETVLLLQAIKRSFGMSNVQIEVASNCLCGEKSGEVMVGKMVEVFS